MVDKALDKDKCAIQAFMSDLVGLITQKLFENKSGAFQGVRLLDCSLEQLNYVVKYN